MMKIALAGSGNVAFHLSATLLEKGYTVSTVASRDAAHAGQLASLRHAKAVPYAETGKDCDLVLVAVSDDAIGDVASQIPAGDFIIAHTSGSVGMDLFAKKFRDFGVFYPLQSFTVNRAVDFSEVPFLIEGNHAGTEKQLLQLAKTVSGRVVMMNSADRAKVHLAAVIANNFVNFLAGIAYDYLEKNRIDGSLLQPLLQETVARLREHHPAVMQTGPARRNDKKVIKKHLKKLENNPDLQSLYRLVSELIINKYHGH